MDSRDVLTSFVWIAGIAKCPDVHIMPVDHSDRVIDWLPPVQGAVPVDGHLLPEMGALLAVLEELLLHLQL